MGYIPIHVSLMDTLKIPPYPNVMEQKSEWKTGISLYLIWLLYLSLEKFAKSKDNMNHFWGLSQSLEGGREGPDISTSWQIFLSSCCRLHPLCLVSCSSNPSMWISWSPRKSRPSERMVPCVWSLNTLGQIGLTTHRDGHCPGFSR